MCAHVRMNRCVLWSPRVWLQVCAIRMPTDLLAANLPGLLEGMLLWASDSKNKFRQKVVGPRRVFTMIWGQLAAAGCYMRRACKQPHCCNTCDNLKDS